MNKQLLWLGLLILVFPIVQALNEGWNIKSECINCSYYYNATIFNGSGNPFNQNLNTTDDVAFNSLTTLLFKANGISWLYPYDVSAGTSTTWISIPNTAYNPAGYIGGLQFYSEDWLTLFGGIDGIGGNLHWEKNIIAQNLCYSNGTNCYVQPTPTNFTNITLNNIFFRDGINGLHWGYDFTTNGSIPSELRLWYKFQSGNEFVDSSSYGNNGTDYTTNPATGQFDEARILNGSTDYILVPADTSLEFSGNLTLEAWINVTGRTSDPNNLQAIISGVTGTPKGYEIALHQNITKYSPYFNIGGGSSWASIESGVWLNYGEWHYITGVYDGLNMIIYIDGTETARTSYSGLNYATNVSRQVGGFYWEDIPTGQRYLYGIIDEVRIWNKALSPSEITNNYNSNSVGAGTTYVEDINLKRTANNTLTLNGSLIIQNNISVNEINSYIYKANGTQGISGNWNCTSYPNITISGGIITNFIC